MTDAERIADGLSDEAIASLKDRCSCGHAAELVDAGLWEPEFPKDNKQQYFLETAFGKSVRQILMDRGRE